MTFIARDHRQNVPRGYTARERLKMPELTCISPTCGQEIYLAMWALFCRTPDGGLYHERCCPNWDCRQVYIDVCIDTLIDAAYELDFAAADRDADTVEIAYDIRFQLRALVKRRKAVKV